MLNKLFNMPGYATRINYSNQTNSFCVEIVNMAATNMHDYDVAYITWESDGTFTYRTDEELKEKTMRARTKDPARDFKSLVDMVYRIIAA